MLVEEKRIRRTSYNKKYLASPKGKEAQKRGRIKWYRNPAKKEANARYRTKNAWKIVVYRLVRRAIRAGELINKPCEVCGKPKAFAHHDDYNKPLEVRWLCNFHHAEYHNKLGIRGN